MNIQNINIGVNINKEELATDIANFFIWSKYRDLNKSKSEEELKELLYVSGRLRNGYNSDFKPEIRVLKVTFLSIIDLSVKRKTKNVNINTVNGDINI